MVTVTTGTAAIRIILIRRITGKSRSTVLTVFRTVVRSGSQSLASTPGTSVQNGCRPVMIVSNDKGNHYAATIVVLPLTSQLKKCDLPSHVELRQADMTKTDPSRPFEDSMILAEQITTIAKSALRNYVGKVENANKLNEISDAVKTQLAI